MRPQKRVNKSSKNLEEYIKDIIAIKITTWLMSMSEKQLSKVLTCRMFQVGDINWGIQASQFKIRTLQVSQMAI